MSMFEFSKKDTHNSFGNSVGTMHRYDLGRTGFAKKESLRNLPAQKWEHKFDSGLGRMLTVAKDTLFIFSKDSYLHAIDVMNGQLKWKCKIEDSGFGADIKASPTIADNIVYFTSSQHLYAFDIENGHTKWKYKAENSGAFGSPIAHESIVFFGCNGYFHAVDMYTGKKIWTIETGRIGAVEIPAIDTDNQSICFMNGSNKFLAVEFKTGNKIWDCKFEDEARFFPSIYNGKVYIGARCHNQVIQDCVSTIYLIDVYNHTIKNMPLSLSGELRTPLTISKSKNRIYAIVGTGNLCGWEMSLSKNIFDRIWSYQLPNETNDYLTPILTEDAIIAGSDNYIIAIDSNSGYELWKYSTKETIISSPIVKDQKIFFSTNSRKVIALE